MTNPWLAVKDFFLSHFSKIIIVLGTAILLFIVIVLLNYFNIINLTSLFPSLPKNVTSLVKSDFDDFIKATLVNKYIPKKYVTSRLVPSNQNLFIDTNFYETAWLSDKIPFSLLIEYDKKNQLSDRQVLVYLPHTMTNFSPSVASQIAKTYLNFNNLTPFLCTNYEKNAINIICEAFWSTDIAKIGVTIISPEPGLNDTKIVYCERRKNNPAYSWKSCDLNFRFTGVQ